MTSPHMNGVELYLTLIMMQYPKYFYYLRSQYAAPGCRSLAEVIEYLTYV